MQHEHYFKIEEMKSKQKILENLFEKKSQKLEKIKNGSDE